MFAQHLFLFNVALLRERHVLSRALCLQAHSHLVTRLHYYPNAAVLFFLDLLNTGVLKHSLQVTCIPFFYDCFVIWVLFAGSCSFRVL
jgi:hypothetical protein